MFKKLTLIAFTVLLVASFANASTKSMPKTEGTIQKIDSATHTLTVQVGSDTKTFHFSSKTQYLTNGKSVKTMDLKEGEKISITADSKNFAKKIELEEQKTN